MAAGAPPHGSLGAAAAEELTAAPHSRVPGGSRRDSIGSGRAVWPIPYEGISSMLEPDRAVSAVVYSAVAERQLKLLVGGSAACTAMVDRQLRCIAASPRWLADFAASREDFLGRPLAELCPDLPSRWWESFRRGLEGESDARERDLMRDDGLGGRWVSWSMCPWREGGGCIGGFVLTMLDASSRRRPQAGDAAPRNHLEDLLFDNPASGMSILDEEGRVLTSNAAFRALVGAEPDGTRGMSLGSFIHPADQGLTEAALNRVQSGDEAALPDLVRYVASGGSERLVRQWLVRLRGSALQPGRVLLVAMDVSEVASMQRRVDDSGRIADAAIASASLAHDLSGAILPLRAFVNALEASALLGARGSPERCHLAGIRRVSEYLQGLVEAVAHGRQGLCDGDGSEQGAATSLDAWWGRSGDFLARVVPHGIDVCFEVPPGVAPVAMQEQRLSQLCLNLLANAGRAVSSRRVAAGAIGRIVIRASSREAEGRRWVSIVVSDDGIGMTGLERRQVVAALDGSGHVGSGLGLTIVRRIVDAAGGRIEVDSTAGVGTRVEVVLPAAP